MSDVFIPLADLSSGGSPFHAGELAVQARAGVVDFANSVGRRSIRTEMPEQHQLFFAERPFMVLGGIDAAGQPWATLRVGTPGFVSALDARTLRIAGSALPGDPLAGTWRVGSMIGGLGVQPETRRRNRVNGVITSLDDNAVTLKVSQSFGNCPKYIQSRTPSFIARDAAEPMLPPSRSSALSEADRVLLQNADTFFIASANGADDAGSARGVDVSHRGGMPGFVQIDAAGTLTVPDFSGNRFFNTLGNLVHDPRAGLLFVDFASGDLVYIAVDAEIVWEGAEVAKVAGAERLMRFHVREVRRTPGVLPFRWSPVEYASQFASMRSEPAAVKAENPANVWHTFNVVDVQEETPAIRSFYLQAADGRTLPAFEPGQYLPIRIPVTGGDQPLVRTYTLSAASDGLRYRISVKREGVASTWLHEHATVGTQLQARTPRGAFTFDAASTRPAVLLSAGIGITPMTAILHSLIAARSTRPVYFIHGARTSQDRPFANVLQQIASAHPPVAVHLLNSAGDSSVAAPDGTRAGRVEIGMVKRLLPFDDYDFYLCGPAAFMSDLYNGLRALTVPDERIRFEAFGPASVKRTPTASAASAPTAATVPAHTAEVIFARSQRTVQWSAQSGTLLELAEANGIPVESSCRIGECGTCSTRLQKGRVAYQGEVAADIEPGCALLCVGRPDAAQSGPVVLDL
ncbi:pyridoxamine 5'-phosphate oxidase family protein [Paraburkholderia bryophila]|uniref:2Fe-2S iron-sulfur cluster-binding protein n=1 Tax=Paraburkholderia bryophila TaxID=420952 RepID=UPI00234AA5D9|nr:pyridoxamine 5'-phosphate oxidase family protein [Paraburkholderia bryophila]WCM23017.1 pyridoxamine 5'-phosphate oxidase family protein [Paraburkholderia bryophila]